MQGRYWLLTIPQHLFTPYHPASIQFMVGQLERGNDTGYLHWQIMVAFKTKIRLAGVKKLFGDEIHAELTRSDAAEAYVSKEDTAVAGTQFTFGSRAIRRNNQNDWIKIRKWAEEGNMSAIADSAPDVYIRHYFPLKKIKNDFEKPKARGPVKVRLFLGPSGTGKTHAAWSTLGTEDTYSKIPTTKWWDGYQGEEKVIVDEFRGTVSVGLLLRWLDPAGYPLTLETKGAQVIAKFNDVILTSNIHPRDWYPDLDLATKNALLRRIEIIEYNQVYEA